MVENSRVWIYHRRSATEETTWLLDVGKADFEVCPSGLLASLGRTIVSNCSHSGGSRRYRHYAPRPGTNANADFWLAVQPRVILLVKAIAPLQSPMLRGRRAEVWWASALHGL